LRLSDKGQSGYGNATAHTLAAIYIVAGSVLSNTSFFDGNVVSSYLLSFTTISLLLLVDVE
jgi:hypothetical protein